MGFVLAQMTKFLENLKKPNFLAILGTLYPFLVKSEFSEFGLCQALLSLIMQKKQKKTHTHTQEKLISSYREKLRTDRQTDRKQ